MAVYKIGDRGDTVKKIQSRLVALGYGISADGIFGKATETAVRTFQYGAKLAVDGIVGKATMTALGVQEGVSTPAPKPISPAENWKVESPLPDNNPPWIDQGLKEIGVARFPAPNSNPKIVQYWKDMKWSGIKEDKTSWCAGYAGAMLERAGIKGSREVSSVPESAKSYLKWGQKLDKPAYGCIVVFDRQGGGHVGFCVGVTPDGRLRILGGNQNSSVNISAFPTTNVLGYRWPNGVPVDLRHLPVGSAQTVKTLA